MIALDLAKIVMMIFVISTTGTWMPCEVAAVPVPPADSSTTTPGSMINSEEPEADEAGRQKRQIAISRSPTVYWDTIATQIDITESAYKHHTRQRQIYKTYYKEQQICNGSKVCYAPDIPIHVRESYMAKYGQTKPTSQEAEELLLELHLGLKKIICDFEKIANAESHHHKRHLLREFEREMFKLEQEVADELQLNPTHTYRKEDCHVPAETNFTETGIRGWMVIKIAEDYIKDWGYIVKDVRKNRW